MRKIVSNGVTHYEFERLAADGRVAHAVFTRLGGVSRPPFASLNLGRTVGDRVEAVEENHRRALGVLDLASRETVSCYQVHGARVGLVGRGHAGTVQPATDALVTRAPGVALLLRFADCAPVLLFAPDVPAVGLAHAGWRGVAAGVVGATVRAMVERLGCDPARMWAGLGPMIGPCCYEVDAATAAAVTRACPDGASVAQQREGRLVLDLAAAVQAQLNAAGIAEVEQAGLCTACHVDEFYSHRAERGHAGRFGIAMGIRG